MRTNLTASRPRVSPSQPAAPGHAAPTRYRLRFVAEALQAAWKHCQRAQRSRGRPRRWRRLAVAWAARLALAGALLLPALLLKPSPAQALAFPRFARYPFGLGDVGANASPTFADIDGDGDLDAFIGEYYGDTVYFRNTGTASSPAFAAPSQPLRLGRRRLGAAPAFADLDGDGDLDAFIGTSTATRSTSGTPARSAAPPSPPPAPTPSAWPA